MQKVQSVYLLLAILFRLSAVFLSLVFDPLAVTVNRDSPLFAGTDGKSIEASDLYYGPRC